MIGFQVSKQELEDLVEQHQAGWLTRAAERTKDLVTQGKYAETSSIWGEIKSVFYHLQHGKCAYCERPLASETYGAVEYDVEHYRPKSVYYWLAYDLENYAVACPTCNRTLKGDEFPMAGTRGSPTQSSSELDSLEQPLLLFPFRDDTTALMDFFGAIPKPRNGQPSERAQTTIEFFCLGDEAREELYFQRFMVIREMFGAFHNIKKQHTPETLESDKKLFQALVSEAAMHTACARAYRHLLEHDFIAAWKIREEAVQYIVEKNTISSQKGNP